MENQTPVASSVHLTDLSKPATVKLILPHMCLIVCSMSVQLMATRIRCVTAYRPMLWPARVQEFKSSHGEAPPSAVGHTVAFYLPMQATYNLLLISTFCFTAAVSCPPHSHYEVCADTCKGTCASFLQQVTCSESCFEGCQCDAGFVSDGIQCVPLDNCGCVHNNKYLTVNFERDLTSAKSGGQEITHIFHFRAKAHH